MKLKLSLVLNVVLLVVVGWLALQNLALEIQLNPAFTDRGAPPMPRDPVFQGPLPPPRPPERFQFRVETGPVDLRLAPPQPRSE